MRVIILVAVLLCSVSGYAADEERFSGVVGLTKEALLERFPESVEPSGSFDLLVSKNLYPYSVPETNTLLRLGQEYIVFELKDGKVVAVHRVSG